MIIIGTRAGQIEGGPDPHRRRIRNTCVKGRSSNHETAPKKWPSSVPAEDVTRVLDRRLPETNVVRFTRK
jgi:hypothetical protein